MSFFHRPNTGCAKSSYTIYYILYTYFWPTLYIKPNETICTYDAEDISRCWTNHKQEFMLKDYVEIRKQTFLEGGGDRKRQPELK